MMGRLIFDNEIKEILKQYARELREEKIKAAWKYIDYDCAGYEFRRDFQSMVAMIY